MSTQPAPDNKISKEILVDGKRVRIDGIVDLSVTVLDDSQNPDPDPDPEKPSEGIIKEGGWGGNPDPKTWSVTNMRNPSDQFKVVDDKGVNIATNFTNMQQAQNFIEYFQTHPFPPETEPEGGTGNGGETGGETGEAKGEDKFGSKLLVSDGKEVYYTLKDNLREDGSRFDGNVGQWTQSEATSYFMLVSELIADEVSIKWSEKSHSGSNEVQCYDFGMKIKTGKTRMRFENPHPDYSSDLGGGQGEAMKLGKWYGFKGTKTVNDDGSVTVEAFQSVGDNEEKPSNDWKKIYSYKDTKYKRTGAHPYVTFRIDDPDKKSHKRDGKANLEKKWLSIAKI